jgi:hypothetical protein
VEQQQEEIERVQRRAEEFGMVEKTAGESGVAGTMQRAWQKWISSALGAHRAFACVSLLPGRPAAR